MALYVLHTWLFLFSFASVSLEFCRAMRIWLQDLNQWSWNLNVNRMFWSFPTRWVPCMSMRLCFTYILSQYFLGRSPLHFGLLYEQKPRRATVFESSLAHGHQTHSESLLLWSGDVQVWHQSGEYLPWETWTSGSFDCSHLLRLSSTTGLAYFYVMRWLIQQ